MENKQTNAHHDIGLNRLADQTLGFEYTQISPGFTSLPEPPRFWRGDFPEPLARFYFSCKEVWPTGVYRASDIVVNGPGLLSRESQKFCIKETNTHIRAYENHSAMHGLAFPAEPKLRIEKPVVLLIGPGFDVYGHWLVDFLPKLYLLQACGIDFRGCQYLMPDTTPQ